jgi:hypothetical protein
MFAKEGKGPSRFGTTSLGGTLEAFRDVPRIWWPRHISQTSPGQFQLRWDIADLGLHAKPGEQ